MKITIRKSQSGWVVYFSNDVENFVTFLSTEPERFMKFIAEKVAGIKLDALIAYRQNEIQRHTDALLGGQRDPNNP